MQLRMTQTTQATLAVSKNVLENDSISFLNGSKRPWFFQWKLSSKTQTTEAKHFLKRKRRHCITLKLNKDWNHRNEIFSYDSGTRNRRNCHTTNCLYDKFNKHKFARLNVYKMVPERFNITCEEAEKNYKNIRSSYGWYLKAKNKCFFRIRKGCCTNTTSIYKMWMAALSYCSKI